MASSRALKIYETDSGKRPFDEWLDDLKDPMTRARVRARLDRVAAGNFGDSNQLVMAFLNCVLLLELESESIMAWTEIR